MHGLLASAPRYLLALGKTPRAASETNLPPTDESEGRPRSVRLWRQRRRWTRVEPLARAGTGDEDAFSALVETDLGPGCGPTATGCSVSVQDAEDAVQNAMLRAWRGLGDVRGAELGAVVAVRDRHQHDAGHRAAPVAARASRRTSGRPRRRERRLRTRCPTPSGLNRTRTSGSPRPPEPGPAAAPAGPEARYEQRESVEIAFMIMLQHLPPLQRAVLILRDVLAFSAAEVAGQLSTTTAAVNSALQRARGAAQAGLPDSSQQATLSALGDARLAAIAARYADALETGDVDSAARHAHRGRAPGACRRCRPGSRATTRCGPG